MKKNLQDQCYDTLGFILIGIILCVWCGSVGIVGVILIFVGIFMGLSNISLIKWFEKFKKNPKTKQPTTTETKEQKMTMNKNETEFYDNFNNLGALTIFYIVLKQLTTWLPKSKQPKSVIFDYIDQQNIRSNVALSTRIPLAF